MSEVRYPAGHITVIQEGHHIRCELCGRQVDHVTVSRVRTGPIELLRLEMTPCGCRWQSGDGGRAYSVTKLDALALLVLEAEEDGV